MSKVAEVEEYYDNIVEKEWTRLDRNRTEFAVTMRTLKEHMPKPPAKILDVGGGPGRYAIALAQQGYAVTLVDLSKRCLEFAKEKAEEAGVKLTSYAHINATNLKQIPRASFDIVLLMGPMYHLLTSKDRRKAINESRRVLKSNGIIFASFVPRLVVVRWVAKFDPTWITEYQKQCKELTTSGLLKTFSMGGRGWTNAYLVNPTEVKPFMEKSGFETLDLIACEGVISGIEEKVEALTGDLWQTWVELNYRLGKHPETHGTAEHLLYVGRKKKSH
jgi:ubiquinone/menaquinone biosynthesis C-methylase UbiE